MLRELPFGWFVAMSTCADALVLAVLVFGGRRLRHRAALRWCLWGGAAFYVLTKHAVLGRLGVGRFGLIHVIYADLVVVLPLVGALILVASAVRSTELRFSRTLRLAAFSSLGMIPVGVYATWIEPFRLQLETARVAVAPERSGTGVVRVGVISDLQTQVVTDYERTAVDRLMAQKPDVIFLTGDLFQGTRPQFEATYPALRELLQRLKAPGGVFLVLGDTDRPGAWFLELLGWSQIRMLVNDSIEVTVGDRRLTIGGTELDVAREPARELVGRLEAAEGDGDIRIVIAHRPDVVLGLREKSRIDLVVAGHTHGGQVVVPGFGPPMTLTRVPRTVAAGGLHAIGGNAIYVSRGVGCERGQAPRIRFLCPPEISLLEIGGQPGAARK
jgi:predicted MPP superfamily phosphohydrolase